MKFNLSSVTKEGARHAIITEIGCHANLSMETPACLMYTRAGAVPHLTSDMVEKMENQPSGVQLTCSTLVDAQETLSQFGKGIAQFARFPGKVTFVSVQDPAHPSRSGYNDKQSVSVFTPAGRVKFDIERFLALQEAIRPDWFEALCDGDTLKGCSMKRTLKSVDRTLSMLDGCIAAKEKSEVLRQAEIFGVIEGGEVLSERQRSARETNLRPVAGFVLDAFSDQAMESDARWDLMSAVIKELPDSKPRLLHGVGKPDDVLCAIETGLDIFDSSFPYEVTERGCALTFPIAIQHSPSEGDSPTVTESATECRQDGMVENGEPNSDGRTRFEVDLSEKRFAEDFTPVLPGCKCYCCKHHTKAYVNHLLNANELLARVLLMKHNFHHYFEFFHTIRNSLKQGTFQQLKQMICGIR